MGSEWTAKQVRKQAHLEDLSASNSKTGDMLTAFAERIEADDAAAATFSRSDVSKWRDDAFENAAQIVDRYAKHFPEVTGAADDIRALITHPPAQAAQFDLRNSLLRGKAQNEEPRVRHLCNMGVGCEEAGICYAEAHGQPEQCGRPTAEPVTQDGMCKICGKDTPHYHLRGTTPTPAPPINLAAVREVIAHLRSFRSNTPPTWAHLDDAADKLEAALPEKGNG